MKRVLESWYHATRNFHVGASIIWACHNERVERVSDAFAHSPKKSVRRVSRELAIPVMSVWRILRRRLQLRPYRLQLLQALKPTD